MAHRGASFEHTVANRYKKQGYRVQRAYMSLGIWDLLCFRRILVGLTAPLNRNEAKSVWLTEVIEVQVKGKELDPFTDDDKAALKAHAEEIGAQAHYAYGKRMPLKKPIGRRRLQNHRTVIIEKL